jgi:hypothetical protein
MVVQRLTDLTGIVAFSDTFGNDQHAKAYTAFMGYGLDVISAGSHASLSDALLSLLDSLHIRMTSNDGWNENPYIQRLKQTLTKLPPVDFNEISYRKV